MNADTINDDVTMAGEGARALLMNRYRIIKQLGQGGMGSVWLAEDTQLDGKLFAIKMLPSILVTNKRAYQQLKAEALVSMKLVHPNIVTLRAFKENDGNPFLVMDYIDGQTLDDYLADRMAGGGRARIPAAPQRLEENPPCQGALTESEVISLLKPVAEALDYAHKEGVVHRDVKPSNVMIRKDGRPFIMDFGIAREIQETMTRVTGKMSSGTLLYMSPEQLNGDVPKASQDIYSFAAMVYECLTGYPPFYRGQIEHQILNNKPEPLAVSSIATPVMAALAKTPEERPGSCMAVLAGEMKSSAAIPNRPKATARPEKGADGLGKRRLGIALAAGLALLGIVAGGAFWLGQSTGNDNRESPAGRTVEQEQERDTPKSVSVATTTSSARRATRYKTGEEKTITLPGGVKMEMIYVGPGEFMMGSPMTEDGRDDDETQHRVRLTKGYWLGKYEVTQAQWQSVMGNNPSDFKGSDRPVEWVSWDDCQEFIKKVNAESDFTVRLPTEAEWEYACRAGSTTAYSWGNVLNGDKANCDGNAPCGTTVKGPYKEATVNVGSYEPNAWGFYDMHGNVSEWCQDWYGEDYYFNSPMEDPTGPASGDNRVLRGGGWNDLARGCRSPDRSWDGPGFRSNDYGFRLSCSVGPRGE